MSAAIICLNEERDLPACLESVRWCDEIVVVVDSRTVDRTEQLAREAGARAYVRDWDSHSGQKNYAFAQCTSDWILSIDADERVLPELRDEILRALQAPQADGYYLARQNYWMGRWIRHGGWYPDYSLRLFRRGRGTSRYLVHERIEVPGPTTKLQSALIHDNIQNINEHLQTAAIATDGEAKEMMANKVRFYWVFPFGPVFRYLVAYLAGPRDPLRAYLLAKEHFKNRVEIIWLVPFMPLVKFLHMYVIKRGFRDGWHGFWVAVLSAIYVVLKYAKFWAFSRELASATRGASRGDSQTSREVGHETR